MRQRLQLLLGATGAVATAAGAHGVVRGVRGVVGASATAEDANVDSELRFFAAWYTAAGFVMLRAANAPERHAWLVRVVSAGWATAAAGRALSIRAMGPPHPVHTGLTVAELTIPVLLLRWLRAVEHFQASGMPAD